ncbi:hypothetical protein MLD52_22985, partial [Puniceicoccaceae bacterium K14]|nr:hypothetical protein [Puniceicoccaceae bacterium K14]
MKDLVDSRVSSSPFSYGWQSDSNRVSSVSHPSGASETRYGYDALLQLTDVGAYNPATAQGGQAIHGISSTYNNLGQRISETREDSSTRSFA